MVYSNRFVLSVLINGQVAQEREDGIVLIPFGSEYAIRCRNRYRNRRALVKLLVDKKEISGGGFVIDANSSTDIKRRADVDTALKFVELTSEEAVEAGKDTNEDGSKGVIEARFYLERQTLRTRQPVVIPMPYPVPVPHPPYRHPWDHSPWEGLRPTHWGSTICDTNIGTTVTNSVAPLNPSYNEISSNASVTDPVTGPMLKSLEPLRHRTEVQEGCTVEGGMTGQTFIPTAFIAEEDFVSLKLVLRGFQPGPADVVGVTSLPEVEYCTNCGQKKGRKTDKFCGKCGTKL